MPPKKQQPRKKNGRKANKAPSSRTRQIASSMKIVQPIAKSKNRANYFRVSDASTARYPDAIRVQGQDYLTSINCNSDVAGTLLYNEVINPLTGVFSNTRLAKYAELYEKFLFKNLRFHYEPVCPTTTSGGVILAYDRDPSDPTPPASDHGLHQYYAMMGTRSGPSWESIVLDCPLSDTQDFYYGNGRGGDERLFCQGQIYVAASTIMPASTALAMLWLEYDVLLFDPQLEEIDVSNRASVDDVNETGVVKQGFNFLVPTGVQIGDKAVSLQTDGDGNNYFNFAREGVYEVITNWANTGNATSVTLQPYVNGVLDATKRNTFLTSLTGTTGNNSTLINVPRQGLQLYSQWTVGWTGGAGDLRTRITNVAPELFALW